MNEETITINIPVRKYIELIDKLEEESWDIADMVHLTMLNGMDLKSAQLYMDKKYKKVNKN